MGHAQSRGIADEDGQHDTRPTERHARGHQTLAASALPQEASPTIAAPESSSHARRKRCLSQSPSESGQSDEGGSQSRRKRRLSWRSAIGLPKVDRAPGQANGQQQQQHRQDGAEPDPQAMQVDADEDAARLTQPPTASAAGQGTPDKGKQRETPTPQPEHQPSASTHSAPTGQAVAGVDTAASSTGVDANSGAHSHASAPPHPGQAKAQAQAQTEAADTPAPRGPQDPFRHLWDDSNRIAAATQPEGQPAVDDSEDAAAAAAHPSGASTPPPHLDALREERERARRSMIQEALGRTHPSPPNPPTFASAQSRRGDSRTVGLSDANHPPAPPSTLSALLGDVLGIRGAAPPGGTGSTPYAGPGFDPSAAFGASGGARPGAATSAQSAGIPPSSAAQAQQPTGQAGTPRPTPAHNTMSGTSVIVQGALIARTVPSHRSRSQRTVAAASSAASSQGQGQGQGFTASNDGSGLPSSGESQRREDGENSNFSFAGQGRSRPTRRASEPSSPGLRIGGAGPGDEPQAATLEEQAAMLSRILGIATAATAASLVNPTSSQAADRALLQSTLQPTVESIDGRNRLRRRRFYGQQAGGEGSATGDGDDDTSSLPSSTGLGRGLRNQLLSISQRARALSRASAALRAARASTTAFVPDVRDSQLHLTESQTAAAELVRRLRRNREPSGDREVSSDDAAMSHQQQQQQPSAPSGSSEGGLELRPTQSSSSSLASSSASLRSSAASSASAWSRLFRHTARNIMSSARGTRNGHGGGTPTNRNNEAPQSEAGGNGGDASSTAGQQGQEYQQQQHRNLPDGHSVGPNDIAGPLRLVREGLPVPQGESGSFGNFLYHLLGDLTVAVQSIRPAGFEQADNVRTTDYFEHANAADATNGAEALDAEDEGEGDVSLAARDRSADDSSWQQQQSASAENDPAPGARHAEDNDDSRERRQRDVQGGQLSFFRLFRFEPVAPSTLIPCVVVGVRSLGVTETLHGEAGIVPPGSAGVGRTAPPSATTTSTRPTSHGSNAEGAGSAAAGGGAEGEDGEAPASRFLLFVSGGRYPESHPLLTANPSAAGRDLMILLELLGMMSAMQARPTTATQQEIDASDLRKVRASEVAALLGEGKVKENTAERCLICLEDWTDDDDCRLLACQHVFHASCVDRWMTSSSNTCPMCRRQGVTKDGRSAGDGDGDGDGGGRVGTAATATTATTTATSTGSDDASAGSGQVV